MGTGSFPGVKRPIIASALKVLNIKILKKEAESSPETLPNTNPHSAKIREKLYLNTKRQYDIKYFISLFLVP
jgi:hypothetical protein